MLSKLIIILFSVIATHSEGNPNARLLTVEEAVGQGFRSVVPEKVSLYWDENDNLTRHRPTQYFPEVNLPQNTDDVVYGDIVSRNEFGIDRGVFYSPDQKLLAVYRKDHSRVRKFPLFDINTKDTRPIRYPMAGEPSELLQLCVFDTSGKQISTLEITDFSEERYLTGVTWSPDSKYIFVQVLDRAQHSMNLNMYRASTGAFVRTILSEKNNKWIEPGEALHFIKGTYKFLYLTDCRTGYYNLFVCDTLSKISRLTPCNADVKYVDNDGKYVYYLSSEISPIEQHLFRIKIGSNRAENLTPETGWHTVDMNSSCTQFIDRYSSFNVPGVTVVKTVEGVEVNHILDALDPIDEYAQVRSELGSVASADGRHTNYYRLFYPRNYDPNKKYPLIVYVYGGPHLQLVNNSWLGNVRMWEYMMAQKGYFVYVQDNRGTPYHGSDYEKSTNRRLGAVEADDQMAGIQELIARIPAIDRNRIGLHGWSYGGFMSLTLNTLHPYFFKVTVAGGPVIDWSWYEVMYTERYMDTPKTNPEGYAQTSLLPKAKDINGRVLICQGLLDKTVVMQHSLSFIQECIKAEKRIDYFPYPLEEHNMMGRARVHLYDKITDYFETYL